jgi:hypothetical protein
MTSLALTSLALARPIERPVAVVVFVVVMFVTASLVGRFAQRLASRFVDRVERRRRRAGGELDTAMMTSLRQRETAIDLHGAESRHRHTDRPRPRRPQSRCTCRPPAVNHLAPCIGRRAHLLWTTSYALHELETHSRLCS